MKFPIVILFFSVLLFGIATNGQTPGVIVEKATGAGSAILDPNSDGYVSSTTAGFTTNDKTQSEIQYRPIPMPGLEPNSDLGPGPDCKYTDFVDSGVEDPAMLAYDGSGNMLIRLRLGGLAPNSKGYSIFIDTDQKMGFTGPNADPNARVGNPGFEIEVSCQTNFGIYLYDVDGSITPTLKTSLLGHDYYQKSVALSTDCGNADYFYDFYIPFSTITAQFPTVTTSTKLRMAIMTSMSPAAALGSNSQSDLSGIDDAAYNYNYDEMFITVIENFYPSTVIEISTSTPLDRSDCPNITGTIISTATSISGTSTEADGTAIKVYKNGALLGSTTVSASAWTLTGVSGLVVGDIITASATASGKSESITNCDAETVASCNTTTSILIAANITYVGGAKGFNVAVARPIGTIVKCYYSNYSLIDPVALALKSPNNLNTVTTTSNPQTVSFECQTGNCFGTGVYYFTVQEPGKCVSDYLMDCHYSSGTASATPTISSPTTITSTTTSITGASTASASIYVYADGVLKGTTTASGAGAWTLSGQTFTTGQVITVKAHEAGNCISAASASKTVSYKTNTPVIVGSYCTGTSITSISGYVSETSGTVQIYKNAVSHGAATTIDADGSWNATGLTLVAGDVVTAVATVASSTASNISTSITIGGKTSNAVVITTGTITEGDASVSGTGTNGDVIKLYADGVQIGSSTVVAGGTWTVGALATYELYSGAIVTATATAAGMCESNESASKTVTCITPSTLLDIAATSSEIYEGTTATITVHSSETTSLYQLMNGAVATGTSRLGNGGDLVLTSGTLSSTATLTVKAIKVAPTACTNNLAETAAISVIPAPMPIELLSFDAKCLNDRIEISWSTAAETNNDYFTIEKSEDLWNFSEFKRIKGAGFSNYRIAYNEVDLSPFRASYYRLKQTDFDGKYTIFNPIYIYCTLENGFSMESVTYSNSTLHIKFLCNLDSIEHIHIHIIDFSGKPLLSKTENLPESGYYQINYESLNLKPGIYMVVAENNKKSMAKKIVILQ